ncbi:MAG: MerR family transcriptional regulator [Clostridiales bacterium]|nr:MerR family transcriptional regulator [Clostridiales bacterium]
MKIGEVSREYKVSVDNIYYYINLGLLVPLRPKGQYYFDRQTLRDLELILDLKKMYFSLKEIHEILSLYRISGLTNRQDIEDLKKIYGIKLDNLHAEKEQIKDNITKLQENISQLNQILPIKPIKTGLPVNMLDLLCCPKCGSSLTLDNVNMNQIYIFNGKLHCDCGYKASIEDGILLTPNKNSDIYDTPDVDRKVYKDLPPSLISLFQKSYNWMVEQINHMDLAGKVVLETYVNAWFFMHNHQQHLDPKGKYIVIDKYPETLYVFKELMEQYDYNLDILFIADSSTDFPLRKHCIDLNIDYFAVNEHNFYHNSFLYDELYPYISDTGKMLGTYFYFVNGQKSMKKLLNEYPTCSKDNFDLSYFMSHMSEHIIDFKDCGYTTSSGNNIGFSFHQDGEKMYLRSYLASMY